MQVDFYFDNRQGRLENVTEMDELIKSVVTESLKKEAPEGHYEVSVVYVDNEEIRLLNKQYRQIDSSTDVLSFPMLDFETPGVICEETNEWDDTIALGDIVLSLEQAAVQAKEYGHSFKREVAYLTVHSLLHLLGYDHMEEGERSVMREKEEILLSAMNITRE